KRIFISESFLQVYLGFIILFVLLSLASLSLSTLPIFQRKLTICEARDLLLYNHKYEDDIENFFAKVKCDSSAEDVLRSIYLKYGNYTDDETFQEDIKEKEASGMGKEYINEMKLKWKLKKISLPNKSARLKVFDLIDLIVLVVFAVDLILRLVTCPSIASYYKSALNVIDTVVLICGILGYTLEKVLINFTYDRGDLDILVYLQQLRVFRLIRVVQNVAAIKVLAFCFKTNIKEILILMLFLFVGVNIFANMLFFVEPKNISSIPQAWWWGIITMTTVGYGDLYPVTFSGRIIGSLCAVSGVIVLALIIPIFVNNFLALYELACLLQKEKDRKPKTKTLKIKVEPSKF
ncbi:potassium voltage-gated channel protein egl-36-like, partial [Saccostrea cucullata]|uniref:potassium voltage-gated channel protein egl-36-like n=1 Tax=Saccostrea cuccullata TaxID=36930 RepID=UPI002ED44CBC